MMHKLLGRIRGNDFARNNLIFFVGSIGVSFLNYLYYPILGRLLSIEAFGELQVLISLFTQMTIFITVLTLISTNIVVNEKDPEVANRTVSELEKITLYVGYGIVALIIIAAPFLQSALKFSSPVPFIIIGLVLLVAIATGFRNSYLRGKGNFLAVATSNSLTASTKIVLSVVFVLIGLSTSGAMGGILAAQLIGLAYAGWAARRLGFEKILRSVRPDWKLLRPYARYAGLVLFVSLITTLQFSVDVAIVKYLFSPEIAGQYAGVATIARIVLFLTASFSVVLLSSVRLDKPAGQNSRLLIRSLMITVALGGVVTLLFVLFPGQVITVLFGSKYDSFAGLLPLLGLTMLTISLANLIANYHVALRHYWVALYVGLGAVVTVILLAFHHSSPAAVVQSIAVGSLVMLIGLVVWTGYRSGYALK